VRPSTLALWRKIRTVEDPEWTRRYNDPDPAKRAFGGRMEFVQKDGRRHVAEKSVADAHPNGARPWAWPNYVGKFDRLALAACGAAERDRFIEMARSLAVLSPDDVRQLHPVLPDSDSVVMQSDRHGIFDYPR
jgi:2-methylcitrate dehydratase